MKIVSLTQVGNESEIIESFIRYNSNFIDKMFILPVCSVDNTLTIIRELIAEKNGGGYSTAGRRAGYFIRTKVSG